MKDDLLTAFQHVARAGDRWTARCPAHDDVHNSLSIGRGDDGRWLLKCHAGCTLAAILDQTQLAMADLFPDATTRSTVLATYRYSDEQGALLYDVIRSAPKKFCVRAANGTPSIKGVRRVLYCLPKLQGRRKLFIVEGEKDADRLWSLGVPTTTNMGGAGKWRREYVEMLQGAGCREIVVLPDNDAPGRTHGLEIARSCVDAGLAVKLIPLPDLPEKGDVSDFLDRHTRDELLALVHDAPLFTPAQLVSTTPALTLMSLADLLDEPDDRVEWVVEQRIPAGGVTLAVAPPKVGKSTLFRQLTVDVATGQLFLGWPTTQGAAWYLAFQDQKAQIKKHLRALGAKATDPIRLFIGQAFATLLPDLHALAQRERPTLIVVDMLAQLLRVKDFNDYAAVTTAFEPLLQLTRDTGAALVLLHHGSAHQFRDGLDAVLGSTALSGCVDNVIVMKRDGATRSISTVQRVGDDVEPTLLTFDKLTGRSSRGATKQAHDDAALGRRMLAVLATAPKPLTESELQDYVEGRKTDKVRVLRILLSGRQVDRFGAGKNGNPYRYCLPGSLSAEPGSHESGRGAYDAPEKADSREPHSPVNGASSPGLFDSRASDVNVVPIDRQEPREPRSRDNVALSTTSSVRTPSFHDPDLVPDDSESSENDPATPVIHPDKHWPERGSHRSEPDDDGTDDPDHERIR